MVKRVDEFTMAIVIGNLGLVPTWSTHKTIIIGIHLGRVADHSTLPENVDIRTPWHLLIEETKTVMSFSIFTNHTYL
jgi:hypothetical protein